MVLTLGLVFLICALICLLLAAFGVPARVHWGYLAAAFLVSAAIAGAGGHVLT